SRMDFIALPISAAAHWSAIDPIDPGPAVELGGRAALSRARRLSYSGMIHRSYSQPFTAPAAAPAAAPAIPQIQPPSHPAVIDATSGTSCNSTTGNTESMPSKGLPTSAPSKAKTTGNIPITQASSTVSHATAQLWTP